MDVWHYPLLGGIPACTIANRMFEQDRILEGILPERIPVEPTEQVENPFG